MINRIKKRHRYRSGLLEKKAWARRQGNSYRRPGKRITIVFPESIDIDGEGRDSTLKIIDTINCGIYEGYKHFLLDFRKTRKIIADGMLLLYAELCNIQNNFEKVRFKCHPVATNKIKQVLKQIGFFCLCKQNCNVNTTRDDVVNWRMCSGIGIISKKFDDIVEQEKEFKQLPPECDLYGGCVEATKNVKRHAYIDNFREIPVCIEKEAWWCFSQIKDKKLHIVVCDLGVSIPFTLPKHKPKLFRWLRLFQATTDADLIEGAVSTPTSRSGESFRGNGLPKIADIAKVDEGSLTIHSRKGFVYYQGTKPAQKMNFKTPLNGTVIAWSLPLGGAE